MNNLTDACIAFRDRCLYFFCAEILTATCIFLGNIYIFYNFSFGDTSSAPVPDSQSTQGTGQKVQSAVSLKVNAALSEVDVLVRLSHKNLADVKVRGMH